MELDIRLNILRDAGELLEADYQLIKKIIVKVKDDFDITLTEENGAMFITHTIMMMKRIRTGELVNPMEDMIKEEIDKNENIVMINKFVEEINNILENKIVEDEKPFIKLHLCTLLDKSKQ